MRGPDSPTARQPDGGSCFVFVSFVSCYLCEEGQAVHSSDCRHIWEQHLEHVMGELAVFCSMAFLCLVFGFVDGELVKNWAAAFPVVDWRLR